MVSAAPHFQIKYEVLRPLPSRTEDLRFDQITPLEWVPCIVVRVVHIIAEVFILLHECMSCSQYYTRSSQTDKFKFNLDKFQELIYDEPKMPNYDTLARSNSILDQLSHRRAPGIFRRADFNCFEITPSIPSKWFQIVARDLHTIVLCFTACFESCHTFPGNSVQLAL